MRIFFTIYIMVLNSALSFGQNTACPPVAIDSIRRVVNDNQLTDYKVAKEALIWILPQLKACKDSVMLPKAYIVLGVLAQAMNEYAEAISYNREFIRMAASLNSLDEKLTYVSYSNISFAMKNLGYYDSAFYYINEALRINERLNLSTQNNLHNLAILYQVTENNSKALEVFKSAAEIGLDTLKYMQGLSNVDQFDIDAKVLGTVSSLTAVVNTSITMGDTLLIRWAFKEIENIASLYKLSAKSQLGIIEAQYKTELAFRNFGRAHQQINKLLDLAKSSQNHFYIARSYMGYAHLSIDSKGIELDYPVASRLMSEGRGTKMDYRDRMEYAFLQSILFLKAKQIDSAIYYNEKYEVLKTLDATNVNQLQFDLEAQRKLRELKTLYREEFNILMKEANPQRNKILYGIIGVLAFGVVVLLLFLFIFNRKKYQIRNEVVK